MWTKGKLLFTAFALFLLLASYASAQTWNGGGINDNWSTAANWLGSVVPINNGTANVSFAGAVRLTPNIDTPYSINSLTFTNTASPFTIVGTSLTVGSGGITNNDLDAQAINNGPTGIFLSAIQTWNANSGPLLITGTVITNGNILTLNSNVNGSSINGSIQGSGSLIKNGNGDLTLTGATANVFTSGITVNAGTLNLNKSAGVNAFGGNLTIGDGAGSDLVQLSASNQIPDTSTVTINAFGLMSIGTFSDTINNLTLAGGSLNSSGGIFGANIITMTNGSISTSGVGKVVILGGGITTNPSGTGGTIAGALDLAGLPRTFNIADGAAVNDLDISAVISNGTISKTGPGTLLLDGNTSNTVGINITAGTVFLNKLGSFSTAVALAGNVGVGPGIIRYLANDEIDDTATVTVNSGGLLDLNGSPDNINTLIMNNGSVQTGTGTLGITALTSTSATTTGTISGKLSLLGGARAFNISETGLAVELDVSAAISNGDLIKTNIGTMRLSGTAANTYNQTTITAGTLLLNKTPGVAAIAGPLNIGDGSFAATVRLEADNQIADTSSITIASGGLLDLNGHLEVINSLNFPSGGATVAAGAGTLTLNGDVTSAASNNTVTFNGALDLAGAGHIFTVADGAASPDLGIFANANNGTIIKNGPGELRLAGNNTAGLIQNAGTVTIATNTPFGTGGATFNGGTLITSGAHTVAGQISFTGPLNIDGAGALTLTGTMFGNGAVTKNGSGGLTIASSSGIAGNWTLNAGTLTLSNTQILSTASLTLNGGDLFGALANFGTLIYNASNFHANLTNRGSLIINNGSLDIAGGLSNFADIFIAGGQTLSVGGTGFINNSQLGISGGTLTLNATTVNNGSINGFGTIGGSGSFTNNGLITQSGGNLEFSSTNFQVNAGNIDMQAGRQLNILSSSMDNRGAINLNSGVIGGNQTLLNTLEGTISGRGTILVGFGNEGLVLAQGGALKIQSNFVNSGTIAIGGLGSSLGGGTITNFGTIQGSGSISNDIANHGTIEAIGGTLIFGAPINNTNSGTIAAAGGAKVLFSNGVGANDGIINLTGGTFDNSFGVLDNTGQISGYGTFRAGGFTNDGAITFTGGPTTINGDVTNSAAHQVRVAYNPALFTGNVTNNGIFKSTSTSVTFSGFYIENGTFISDPADNFFSNVSIGANGAWQGGRGDRFILTGDFLNSSINKTGWQTNDAELRFTGGVDHLLSILGKDLGPIFEGYDDNFSWGTLSLGPSDGLIVTSSGDGDAAIYVRQLLLADGLNQLSRISSNGSNIYYDLSDSSNTYLHGQTYNLPGGGQLAPVPEPGTLGVAGLGLLIFACRRRKSCALVVQPHCSEFSSPSFLSSHNQRAALSGTVAA